jgi:hypothetical protein
MTTTYPQAVEGVAAAIEAERLRLGLPLAVEMLPARPGWCRVRDGWNVPVDVQAGALLQLLLLIPWPLPPEDAAGVDPREPGKEPPKAPPAFWDEKLFWPLLMGYAHDPADAEGRADSAAHGWAFARFEELLEGTTFEAVVAEAIGAATKRQAGGKA